MTPRCPPDERFPAGVGLDRELTAGDGVFGADPARVGAGTAGEDIDDRRVDLTLGEPIVSGARQEHICADPGMQVIVAHATHDDIVPVLGVTEIEHIVAATTEQHIVPVFSVA